MREYLLKTEDCTYQYHNENHDVCPKYVEKIEIPEGADVATIRKSAIVFWDKSGNRTPLTRKFDINIDDATKQLGAVVIWQRQTHPEELPFIGNEVHEAVISDFKIGDSINHPPHYASSSIECIDAMQAMLTPEQFIGYLRGNIFKYQWRYENKGGIQDLEKSQWYLNRLLSVLQS